VVADNLVTSPDLETPANWRTAGYRSAIIAWHAIGGATMPLDTSTYEAT